MGALFRIEPVEVAFEDFGGGKNDSERGPELVRDEGDEVAFYLHEIAFAFEGVVQLRGPLVDAALEGEVGLDESSSRCCTWWRGR